MLLENAERSLQQVHPELKRITIAGDLRRGCELVADLALVAEAPALADGPTTLASGGGLKVHLTDKRRYGITLLLATGSPQHIEGLHALATRKGLKLGPEGLLRGRKVFAARSEEDIYAALGLPFIEPELREGRGEIERAIKGKLPALVTDRDVRGILHAHTDLSDGVDPLEVMAQASRERGYQYFGVADHSKSAHYAGGLSVEEIIQQHQRHRPIERVLWERLSDSQRRRIRIFWPTARWTIQMTCWSGSTSSWPACIAASSLIPKARRTASSARWQILTPLSSAI